MTKVLNSYLSRYYGDGDDTFSRNEWEAELWSLLRSTYELKKALDPDFVAPDYETIIECEEQLQLMGLTRTYRD